MAFVVVADGHLLAALLPSVWLPFYAPQMKMQTDNGRQSTTSTWMYGWVYMWVYLWVCQCVSVWGRRPGKRRLTMTSHYWRQWIQLQPAQIPLSLTLTLTLCLSVFPFLSRSLFITAAHWQLLCTQYSLPTCISVMSYDWAWKNTKWKENKTIHINTKQLWF